MYCSSCGSESPVELNYCTRCGANLNVSSQPVTPLNVTKPTLIVGLLMLFITLGGFAGVIASAAELARHGGGDGLSMAIVCFGTIAILAIDVLLFTLLWKLIKASLASANLLTKSPPPPQPTQFAPPATAKLEPGSVTEDTTRFFDDYPPAAVPEPTPIKKTDR